MQYSKIELDMVTLQANIHFWTLRDDIVVKDADMGAFKYQDKSCLSKERIYYHDKRKFFESRGLLMLPKNNRPDRLRDSLREFEEILMKEKVVHEKWRSNRIYFIMMSSGLIVTLKINSTQDLVSITFDKILVGKLLSEHVVDVIITPNYMIVSYNESRLTIVQFNKALSGEDGFSRFSCFDPRITVFDTDGPSGRRFQRRLSCNYARDMIVIWWHTSHDEIYPWSPVSKDRNRANILVYALSGGSMDLICYCRTEMSPLSVTFSKMHNNTLLTVEQGFAKKGEITVTSCMYKVGKNFLQRSAYSSIPLEAPLTAHAHNPTEDCLLLACNSGVISLHSDDRGMTHVTKAALIPTTMSWLPCGSIVMISNDRGQIQCFDSALSLVRLQITSENNNPQKMVDLSDYFSTPPSLEKICWAPQTPGPNTTNESNMLILHFAQGPFACIAFSGQRDENLISIHTLTSQYIKHRQIDEALNLLVSLDWNKEGVLALKCLTRILNHLFRQPLSTQSETHMEACLGTFHVPVQPLTRTTKEEFGPPVRVLTRKFFFKVLRSGRIEKAYRIALDLKDYDCFIYVNQVALRRGDQELSAAALTSARELDAESTDCDSCSNVLYRESCESSCSSHSCSDSCCSQCYSESESEPPSLDEAMEDNMSLEDQGNASEVPDTSPRDEPPLSHIIKNSNISQPKAGNQPPPSTLTTAITNEGGTVTINIRQSDVPPPVPPPPLALRHDYEASSLPPQVPTPQIAVNVDKADLQNQYEKTFFQEVSTEEEDGSTVKVVHFGVV